jgi:transposase
MKANIKQIKKHRKFSVDFKKEIVSAFERGQFSILQLARLYGISNRSIYNWIYQFSTFNEKGIRVVELKASSMAKLSALEKRVKELEQIIGQKQIKIDYLEKMIDIARDDFGMDIKKNFNTPQSTGSDQTKSK